MIEEEGLVTAVEGKTATVSVLKKSACESCAAAGACHPQDADRFFITADNPLKATPGQKVKLLIDPHLYLKRSALIQYGVPAAALVSGAIIVKDFSLRYAAEANSDLWAFCAGVFCMLASVVFMRMYTRSVVKKQKRRPVIVELLS